MNEKQRYFLSSELINLNPEVAENLNKLQPVIEEFKSKINNSKTEQLGEKFPATIRFNEDGSEVYLCQSDFAEGKTIDHHGEILARVKVADFVNA